MFSKASNELCIIESVLANDETEFRFNPNSAPRFAGHFEAGIKSVLYHLNRAIGKQPIFPPMNCFQLYAHKLSCVDYPPSLQLPEHPDELPVYNPTKGLISLFVKHQMQFGTKPEQ